MIKSIKFGTIYLMKIGKEIAAKFFKTESGNEPVRDFLKELLPVDRKIIGVDIMTIEMSWPIGYPTVRKLDTNLWEVRSKISDKRISRVFFTIEGSDMILLHAIIKKSQKTPQEDIDLSKKRRNLVLGRHYE